MGMDMTLHIIDKDGNYIDKDIFDGRNSEWFGNFRGNGIGSDSTYDYWHPEDGIPENCPEDIKTLYDDCTRPLEENENAWDRESYGYYGFCYASVGDWFKFVEQHHPEKEAGWATRYEEFQYRVKGIEYEDLPYFLDKDDNINDYVWVEYDKKYDCSMWLYKLLKMSAVPETAYLVYYFDC